MRILNPNPERPANPHSPIWDVESGIWNPSRRGAAAGLLAALVAFAGLAIGGEAADWPMYGLGPARQSRSPARFPSTTLGREWATREPRTLYTYIEGTPYYSSPSLATVRGRSLVFIGSYDKNVYAYDAATGAELWHYNTGNAVSATPVYAAIGGRPVLFVASADRSIYALDPLSPLPAGQERVLWQFETFRWEQETVNPARMANPLVAPIDGRPVLFCGVWNNNQSGTRNVQIGEVVALDPAPRRDLPESRRVLWRRTLGTGAVNTPCLGSVGGEPALFVPYEPGAIFAVSARDGRDLWEKPYAAGEEIHGGLSVAAVNGQQLIFFGGRTAWAYCVDAETGEQVWATNVGTWVDSTPAFAVIDGEPMVFFGTYTYHVYACNAQTGEVRWGYRTRGFVQGSPAVAWMGDEPVVCVNSLDNHVYVIGARDGRFIFRHHLGEFPWTHFRKGYTIWSSCIVGTVNGQAMLIAPSYSGVIRAFCVNGRDDNAGPPRDSFWDALGVAYTIPVLIVVVLALVLTFRRLRRRSRQENAPAPS